MHKSCDKTFTVNSNESAFASTLLCNRQVHLPLEVRYVFDIGSGTTKSIEVLVDKLNGKVVKTLQEENISMPYQKCISESVDGKTLPEKCMVEGLQSLMKILEKYGIEDIAQVKNAGIATAWARNAENNQEYMDLLKQHGFNFRVITQKEEGQIGYKAADSHYMPCDAEQRLAIVWDIGGGSYQLSAKDDDGSIYVYKGAYGSSNFKQAVNKYLENKFVTNSEIFWSEDVVNAIEELARRDVSDVIKSDKKLASMMHGKCVDLIGIGQFINDGVKGIFGSSDLVYKAKIAEIIEGTYNITKEVAKQLFPTRKPEFIGNTQSDLILTKAIMEGLDKDSFISVDARSVDYVATDPSFWPEFVAAQNATNIFDESIPTTCIHQDDDSNLVMSIISYI